MKNELEKWAYEYFKEALVSMQARTDRGSGGRSKKEIMTRAFMSGARKMQKEILKKEIICCDRIVPVEKIKETGEQEIYD